MTAKKKKSTADPLHQDRIERWCKAWQVKHGTKYPFQPIDARKLATFGRLCGGAVVEDQVIALYLADEDKFLAGHSTAMLLHNLPRYFAKLRGRAKGGRMAEIGPRRKIDMILAGTGAKYNGINRLEVLKLHFIEAWHQAQNDLMRDVIRRQYADALTELGIAPAEAKTMAEGAIQ